MRLQTMTERNGITSGHHIAYLFVNFFDHNKDRSLWAVERYMDEEEEQILFPRNCCWTLPIDLRPIDD